MPDIHLVWLNGGPGCSSLTGLTYENGPLIFYKRTAVPCPNPNSWTKLADVLYIDQPVGTGYSSGSKAPLNNAQVTSDLFHWLKAFYDRFPALKRKNTYIMGESYAGIYVRAQQSIINTTAFAVTASEIQMPVLQTSYTMSTSLSPSCYY